MTPSPQDIANWKKYHEIFSTAFLHEALGAVARLDIASAVGEEATTAASIANQLSLDEESVYRVLRALASYGIFEESQGRLFKHNSFSRQLTPEHPFSMHGMIQLWTCDPFRKAWGKFNAALKDGSSSFSHANGASVYEFADSNPDLAALFHQGMENNSAIVSDAIAMGFPFEKIEKVVDLGGGIGTQLAAILRRHQNTVGAVFDLEPAAAAFRESMSRRELADRASFIAGDWFDAVPSGFDVYLVKNSLWNWTDANCLAILKNIRRAMTDDAQLLIIEYLVDSASHPWSTAFDLQQLNVTGGRGRTESEYRKLLNEAGLEISASFRIENENILQCRRIG